MRIIFFGSPGFALPSLEALRDSGHTVALVVSQPGKPVGRGARPTDPPVATRAKSLGLLVFQPETLKDDAAVARLEEVHADAFIVVAYGRILSRRVLDLPRFGCLNVHGSLLPRWRGASPVQAAILAGDAVTGVSIMRMEAGLDTGPVYATRETRIGEEESAEELGGRLAELGADALVETLYFLEGSHAPSKRIFLPPLPQNSSLATTCPKITREDARVDWTQAAVELARRSRAFTPWPGLFTIRRNTRVKLSRLSLIARVPSVREGAEESSPGTILEAGPRLVVSCGEGAVSIGEAPGGRATCSSRGRVHARRARLARRALGLMADERPVRERALGVLVRVARDGAHAAPLIEARGRDLAPRDRDFLRALVKKTLRGALRLDHVLARHVRQTLESLDLPVLAALRLGAAQALLMDRVPPHAAVGETVAAARTFAPNAAGLVNAVLRRVAANEARPGAVLLPADADPIRRLAVETSHPEWLVSRWVAAFGREAARGALAADDDDSPMDLLADPLAGPPEEILAKLEQGGVTAVRSPWAPLALTVAAGNAALHPLVSSGVLAVVDVAAQAFVSLVPASGIVVDLAAAPGGKTRTLLATGTARRVIALERSASRLARLARNLEAAGRRGEVLAVRADAGRAPLPRGRFESILLDAPCSGTGTLRKNPEIRLRLQPRDLATFARIQSRLLAEALELLAPGGTLVYVTCSLEREENEEVVESVLAGWPGIARVVPDAAALSMPLANAISPSGLVRVLPGATHDGFSAIVLRRNSLR